MNLSQSRVALTAQQDMTYPATVERPTEFERRFTAERTIDSREVRLMVAPEIGVPNPRTRERSTEMWSGAQNSGALVIRREEQRSTEAKQKRRLRRENNHE